MHQEDNVKIFVNGLLLHPIIQKLKLVDDKGISVSAHTYDVLQVAIKLIKKKYRSLEDAQEELDFFAMVAGVILHDSTKATIRLNGEPTSHSVIMKYHPQYVDEEARLIIREVEAFTKLKLSDAYKERIVHIVLSHHGQWGKVYPETREAKIVYEADKYSATYHRITPIGAKEIVKLMCDGFKKDEIIKILGQTPGIIDDRLKKSKNQLGVKTNRDLMNYYRKNGYVPLGDESFSRRIYETERLIKKVDKFGFEDLILKNPLMDYIFNEDIFI